MKEERERLKRERKYEVRERERAWGRYCWPNEKKREERRRKQKEGRKERRRA